MNSKFVLGWYRIGRSVIVETKPRQALRRSGSLSYLLLHVSIFKPLFAQLAL